MTRVFGAGLAAVLMFGTTAAIRADEKDASAIIDKAVTALGGEKLTKAEAFNWKQKGTITFNGTDNEFSVDATFKGLDHYRSEFKGKFGDNDVMGVVILNGDKGWRRFGEDEHDMEGDELTNEKRTVYLAVVPITVVALKDKKFKTEAAGEEKVGDKPAAVVKVTGPDGKDFKISFDKASGLPVKLVAKVIGFNGEEFEQETTFQDYKEFGGIKKATKIESKRDGEKFVNMEVTDFKVLDKAGDDTFSKPK